MATRDDVRRIALSLPETSEGVDRFAFSVRNEDKDMGFAWSWMERVEPKEPRVENAGVIAVRVADAAEKEMLLAADPETFFTEPALRGVPGHPRPPRRDRRRRARGVAHGWVALPGPKRS